MGAVFSILVRGQAGSLSSWGLLTGRQSSNVTAAGWDWRCGFFEEEVGMRRGGTGRETYPVRVLGKRFLWGHEFDLRPTGRPQVG